MRIPIETHREQPWRAHTLAHDFELIDLWEYDITGHDHEFDAFLDAAERAQIDAIQSWGPVGILFRLRGGMGRIFGWDEEVNTLPIPGCGEATVRERLTADEAAAQPWTRGEDTEIRPVDFGGFRLVYRDAREVIYELSNGTVHALLHHVWVSTPRGAVPRMGVYVKHRGWLGRAYMKAIEPFRHLIVYPWLLRGVQRQWARARSVLRPAHGQSA